MTWWSSDQLPTWAQRPWNTEGKQLPLVHHAQVDVQAKFADFAALSRWITQAYADALDLGPVRVRAIADAGMLGNGLDPTGGGGGQSYARLAVAGGGDDLVFTPQDVAVSTEVDAVFVTS